MTGAAGGGGLTRAGGFMQNLSCVSVFNWSTQAQFHSGAHRGSQGLLLGNPVDFLWCKSAFSWGQTYRQGYSEQV